MGSDDQMARPRRLRIQTVRGEPYQVGGRTLTPVVRIVSFGRANGTVAAEDVSGWGAGFVRITPVALVEAGDQGERRIVLYDATARVLRGLFVKSLAMVLFLGTIRWLACRKPRPAKKA